MPIYEYACTACDHRTDILHGLNDPGPTFCPSCGREGTMRKLFAPPTIHFKGSGWAKKDRGSTSSTKASAASKSSSGDGASSDGGSSGSDTGSSSRTEGGSSSGTDSSSSSAGPSKSGD